MASDQDENVAVSPWKEKISPLRIFKKITIEPLLLVSLFTIVLYSIVSQQYIYYRISKNYGISNETESSACSSANSSNDTNHLQKQVSAEASSWVLYLNVAGFIPSLFCTVLIGTWGDTVGRKLPLIFSFTGLLFMIVVYIIVIHLELPVAYLLIARIVGGLGGDMNAIFCSCYAYIADISSHKSRTLRVAIGEASSGIGGFTASIISGIWIDSQGFESPLWLLFALLLSSVIYIQLVLNESCKTSFNSSSTAVKLRSLFTCRHYVGLWEFLSENWNRTCKLLGLVLCFFLQLCVHDGTGDTIVIYELSPPLCWSSTLIGYGSALRDSSYLVGVAIVKILNGFLSDIILIFFSSVSTTVSLLFYAFASVTGMMFIGYSIALLKTVSATVLRSMISRLTGQESQGSAFALIACAESIASLVASLVFNAIYSSTVDDFRGTVFIVGAGIQVIFFILVSFLYNKTKSDLLANEAEEYHRFNVNV